MTIITGKPQKKNLLKAAGAIAGQNQRFPSVREEDGKNPGLLSVHNSTISHGLFYVGASKIKVSRNYPYKPIDYEHKRGEIQGFSISSRRRLLSKLAEIQRDDLPLWCALTFPDEYHDHIKEPAHWKKLYKRLISRIRRHFPTIGLIWRLETETRKSGLYPGEIFPHFHLIVYGVEELTFRTWLAENWYKACGKLSIKHLAAGTSCKKVNSTRQLFAYVSKYMAKPGCENLNIGRIWGVLKPENIPFVKGVLVQLTEKEAVTLIRYMRRYARVKSRDYKSLTVFLDASFWYYRLADILYPP